MFWPFTRKPLPLPIPVKAQRSDGFSNELLGYGTDRDKTTFGVFTPADLSFRTLENAVEANEVAHKAVSLVPEEAFRLGFTTSEETEAVDALKLADIVRESLIDANTYGGCAIYLGTQTGDPALPLSDSDRVNYLVSITAEFCKAYSYYNAPLTDKHGKPEFYQVVPETEAGGYFVVHESRIVRCEGARLSRIRARQKFSWGNSSLVRAYESILRMETAYGSAGVLLSDAAQAVFKIRGFYEALSGGNQKEILDRLAMVNLYKSSGRAVVLDSEGEDYARQSTPFTGIPEMLAKLESRVASDLGCPVTLLFGVSPGGLNATGASDIQGWYGNVDRYRENVAKPILEKILFHATGKKIEVTFPSLQSPTEKEKAETDKTIAETDQIYVNIGVVHPEQVAIARFGGGDGTIEVDVSSLESSLASELNQALTNVQTPLTSPTQPTIPPATSA